MKSIEELQADLKQLYNELEERRQMEQESIPQTVNFAELSSKAERVKIEQHPMNGRPEREQQMYLLLLLSVIALDDTSYGTSFSLLYRIAHGMGFKGDVQELFLQAQQINFERIDEITRLFLNEDVKLVMLMECMMLAQGFQKERKKAMEYIAELCILMKLEKEQVVLISNFARVILMQDVKEYHCKIQNTYRVFDCYVSMFLKTEQITIRLVIKKRIKAQDYNFSEIREKEGCSSYMYKPLVGALWWRATSNDESDTYKMFEINKHESVVHFRRKITYNEIEKGSVVVAVITNAPYLAYGLAMEKYKASGGIIEEGE